MNVTTLKQMRGPSFQKGFATPKLGEEQTAAPTITDTFEPSPVGEDSKKPSKLLSNLKMAGLYAAGAAALAATPLAGEMVAMGSALVGGMVLMDSLTGLLSVESRAARAAAAIVGSLAGPAFIIAAGVPAIAAVTHGAIGAGLAIGGAALLGAARDSIQTAFDWPVKG